jgi:hypothetical protein
MMQMEMAACMYVHGSRYSRESKEIHGLVDILELWEEFVGTWKIGAGWM